MILSRKQIDNLIAGVKLVAQLEPSSREFKKYVLVFGYTYSRVTKKREGLNKYIKNNIEDKVYYTVLCYEIPLLFYEEERQYDINESVILNVKKIEDIQSINQLQAILGGFISEPVQLLPDWDTDNFI